MVRMVVVAVVMIILLGSVEGRMVVVIIRGSSSYVDGSGRGTCVSSDSGSANQPTNQPPN